MNLVVHPEQQLPDEERDPTDPVKECFLDDDCWEPVELGDFALPHLYLGVFSVCTMLVFLKELLTGPEHHFVKGYRLVYYGLLVTLFFNLFNLYLFIVLSTKHNFDENMENFEVDWEVAFDRKELAYWLWGYGVVTSYFFIVGCLVKYLGTQV